MEQYISTGCLTGWLKKAYNFSNFHITISKFQHDLHEGSKLYWVNFHDCNYDTHKVTLIQSLQS